MPTAGPLRCRVDREPIMAYLQKTANDLKYLLPSGAVGRMPEEFARVSIQHIATTVFGPTFTARLKIDTDLSGNITSGMCEGLPGHCARVQLNPTIFMSITPGHIFECHGILCNSPLGIIMEVIFHELVHAKMMFDGTFKQKQQHGPAFMALVGDLFGHTDFRTNFRKPWNPLAPQTVRAGQVYYARHGTWRKVTVENTNGLSGRKARVLDPKYNVTLRIPYQFLFKTIPSDKTVDDPVWGQGTSPQMLALALKAFENQHGKKTLKRPREDPSKDPGHPASSDVSSSKVPKLCDFDLSITTGLLTWRAGRPCEAGCIVNDWGAVYAWARFLQANNPLLYALLSNGGCVNHDRSWSAAQAKPLSPSSLNKTAHVDFPKWTKVPGASLRELHAVLPPTAAPKSGETMTPLPFGAFKDWVVSRRSAGRKITFIYFKAIDPNNDARRAVAVQSPSSAAYHVHNNKIGIIALCQDQVHGLATNHCNAEGVYLSFASEEERLQQALQEDALVQRVLGGRLSSVFADPRLYTLCDSLQGETPLFRWMVRRAACLAHGKYGQSILYPSGKTVQLPPPHAWRWFPTNDQRQARFPPKGTMSSEEMLQMAKTLQAWGVWHIWKHVFKVFGHAFQVNVVQKYPLDFQTQCLGFSTMMAFPWHERV